MKTPALLTSCIALAACQAGDIPGNVPGSSADTAAFQGIGAGETVRFTGTEPFWGGHVAGEQLVYETPSETGEGINSEPVAVKRFAGRGGVSWSGTLDGARFALVVSDAPCSDGMSDRTYPFTATLEVRGEQRNGCAWTETQPFEGSSAP